MKNKDIPVMFDALMQIKTDQKLLSSLDRDFSYAIIKNVKLLEEELKDFKEMDGWQPHPDYPMYEAERRALCQVHAEKDEAGNPITKLSPDGRTSTYSLATPIEFQKEMEELREKYKEAAESFEKRMNDVNSFMEKDIDDFQSKLRKVDINSIPKNFNMPIIEKIQFMIN